MYYLNKKEIDFEKIVDLSLSNSKDRWFINIKTGKLKKNLKKGTWNENYYEIPKVSSFERFSNLAEYTEQMLEDEKMADKIMSFLKKDNFDKAMELMKKTEDYKYYGFQTWESMPAADFIYDWLYDLPVEFEEKMDHDCDCPVCMAMQKADEEGRTMGLSEIKNTFQDANDSQFLNDSWKRSNKKNKTIKSVEENLLKILEGKEITLDDVKNKIYEEGKNMTPIESSMDFQKWWMKYFELDMQKSNSVQDLMDIFTNAWNYFPHKSLDGKSPNEMLLDYKEK